MLTYAESNGIKNPFYTLLSVRTWTQVIQGANKAPLQGFRV